jgi:hypothetical protein
VPNWCYNYLDISGDETLIADIKRQLNKPFAKDHDSWNPATGQMEVSQTTYSSPVFAFHNIYNHRQDGISDEEYIKQPDHSMPLEEALMFKGNHWYDWNVRNWGTKWDVAVRDGEEYPDTELYEESTTVLGYKFNTAWSPPTEAITKLSEQYPSLEMNLSYEEETGWGGSINFNNGIATEEESYDNKCRDCDSLNTLEYCENDCGEICNECHYMGEADLDCVSDCEIHKVYLDKEHLSTDLTMSVPNEIIE